MRKINANTKQGMKMIEAAKHFEGHTLDDVYGKCSWQKETCMA